MNCYFNNFKTNKTLSALLLAIIMLIGANSAKGQCPNDNNFWASEGQPPCGTDRSVQTGGGTYVEFDVVTGANYTFNTCNSPFDTQLTGYEGNSPASLFYNNNNGPICTGNQASVIWTSTFTGTLRVNVDQFSCQPNATSAILRFRQNDNLTFNPPTPMCVGDASINLSNYSNSTAGTYSGPGVTGVTFDPVQAGVGNHAITYTLAQCSEQVYIVVTASPTVNITKVDVNCNGLSSGEATANVSGGVGTYTYLWSDPSAQTTATATGLSVGTYTVTVTDANSCETIESVTIDQPPVLAVSVVSTIDPSCRGVNNGQIEVLATGGSTPYEYSINGSPYQASPTFVNLPAGSFIIEVRDAGLCTESTSSVTLTNSYNITAVLDSVQGTSCARGTDGFIEVSATGGTSPYEFSKDNVIFQASGIFNSLSSGSYSILAKDAVGCSDILQVVVTEPSEILVELDSIHNVDCKGNTSGAVYISTSGGSAPYTYLWSDGSVTEDLLGAAVGVHKLTVTDANNCTAHFQATVNEPLELFLNLAALKNASCYGKEDAVIDITINGGVPAYTYLWSEGSSLEDLSNVGFGTYSVTVTDANGCTLDSSFSVTQPDSITTSITGTDADCSNGIGGNVDLTVSGGSPNYTYFWSNGAFTEDLNDVPGGLYSVQVIDNNACSATDTFRVGEPNPIVVDVFSKSAGCGDDADGIIELTVSGGTPISGGTQNYNYAWAGRPADTTNRILNVQSGTYSVTVSDANGCQAVETIVLSSYAEPNTSFFVQNACLGETIDFYNNSTIPNGSMTFEWVFGDGDTTIIPSPRHLYLEAGTYTVSLKATSNNDCSVTIDTTIVVYALPEAQILIDGDTLNECSKERAVLSTTYDANYMYQWSNGADSVVTVVDQAGEYSVLVTDENNCSNKAFATVRILDPSSVSVSNDTTISYGFAAQLLATGGVAYTWTPSTGLSSDIVSNPLATPLNDQTYRVDIEGEFGCMYSDSVTVTVVQDFNLEIPNIITPNGDGFNDEWKIANIYSYPDNQVLIFNRWGNEVYSAKNYDNKWNGDDLSDGTYYYIITFDNSETVYKGAVTILR